MSDPNQPPESTYGESASPQQPPPPQQPAYQPPPAQAGPGQPPMPAPPGDPNQLTSDERTWGMLSHLSGLLLGFLGPLLIMLLKGEESKRYIRPQAVEALNFQITLLIAYVVSFVLIFVIIGIFTLLATVVAGFIFMILAGIKANNGEMYRYPINIRMVK